MGMIRRADLEQVTRQATVMDLSDLRARGEAIIAEAGREAERILAEARAERERLIAGADTTGHDEGYGRGLEEGRERGRQEGIRAARDAQLDTIGGVCAAWLAALESFESSRESMLSGARQEIVALAVEIAARVVRRSIEVDPGAVLPQIEAVLGAITRPTRLVVRVHPEDFEVARVELPAIVARFEQCRNAELITDQTLERGSCVASTEGGGRIDADVGAQLDRVVAELLPDNPPGLRVDRDPRSDAA